MKIIRRQFDQMAIMFKANLAKGFNYYGNLQQVYNEVEEIYAITTENNFSVDTQNEWREKLKAVRQCIRNTITFEDAKIGMKFLNEKYGGYNDIDRALKNEIDKAYARGLSKSEKLQNFGRPQMMFPQPVVANPNAFGVIHPQFFPDEMTIEHRQFERPNYESRRNLRCYSCDEIGHLAKNCPRRNKPVRGRGRGRKFNRN